MTEPKRQRVIINGVEVDAPAEWTLEEIQERRREMHEHLNRTRAETETLDNATAHRAILEHMANADPPWPPDAIAFLESVVDAEEIAALYRAFEEPLTDEERLDLLRKMQNRRGGGE